MNTTSAAQTITVTNTGSGNLTVPSVVVSAPFAETNTCTANPIAPAGTCTISVHFQSDSGGNLQRNRNDHRQRGEQSADGDSERNWNGGGYGDHRADKLDVRCSGDWLRQRTADGDDHERRQLRPLA